MTPGAPSDNRQPANRTELSARIVEQAALRLTPAAVPVLDLTLEHDSSIEEAGTQRQVKLTLRAVALGAVAERLARQAIGTEWRFVGFLVTPRRGQRVVLHVQDFRQD